MSTELGQANLRSTVYGSSVRSQPITSYAELQKHLRNDLRAQNPEWIDSDGSGGPGNPQLIYGLYHCHPMFAQSNMELLKRFKATLNHCPRDNGTEPSTKQIYG